MHKYLIKKSEIKRKIKKKLGTLFIYKHKIYVFIPLFLSVDTFFIFNLFSLFLFDYFLIFILFFFYFFLLFLFSLPITPLMREESWWNRTLFIYLYLYYLEMKYIECAETRSRWRQRHWNLSSEFWPLCNEKRWLTLPLSPLT